jgi:hypothetical protein
MRIFVPSRGRWALPHTLTRLPESILKRTTLVVPPDEYDNYHSVYPDVHIAAPGVYSIGAVRQWITEQADKVCMVDDDLTFATRRGDEPNKFRPATMGEIGDMFYVIEAMLREDPHIGVATREGGNVFTGNVKFNTRILRILAYDTNVLRKHGIRFDRMEIMEDFDVALQLLELGYANYCINWIVHDQKGSGTYGGCSTYRTLESQAEAAHKLKALHPEFVKVIQKETKTAWGGGTRTDVRISWKKAYEYGKSRQAGLLDAGAGECQAKEGGFSP